MMIMSQDRKRFVIVGRGTAIYAWDDNGTATISCTFGQRDEDDIILGKYNSMETAKEIVQKIYDTIENQEGNFIMPTAEEIEKKKEMEKQMAYLRNPHMVREGETSIYNLGLSTRMLTCLTRNGIHSLEELKATPKESILKMRNMGPGTYQELIDKGIMEE